MRLEARWDRFTRGWNPHNLPGDYLNPREVREGQVLDARNLRFTPGGTIFWDRNQLRIHSPSNVMVKSLVDFTTSDYTQLLAFCKSGSTGELYYLTTDWSSVGTPTQWTYGYEVFASQSWTKVTAESDALAHLRTVGIAAHAKVRERLLICPTAGRPVLEWDGSTLRVVGLSAPPIAPSLGSVGSGDLSAGTYSYYYTYYDPESGYESMPSPVLDVHCSTDGNKITVTGITDYGDGYFKRLYRAYTEDYAEDARGSEFYLVTTLPPGTGAGSTEDLTTWTEVDTEGRLTVATNQLDATGLEEDDTVYLYSDEGEGSIQNFSYQLSFSVASMNDGTDVILVGTSNSLSVFDSWSIPAAFVLLRRNGTHYQVYVGWKGFAMELVAEIATGTTYYLKFTRTYATIAATLYDNPDYSGEPLGRGDVTGNPPTFYLLGFRYIYLACAYGGTGTNAATFQITDVVLNSATTFVDNTPEYALGDEIAFDHALPPRGSIMAYHKERLFIAGSNEGSRSYPGYRQGYWGNVLFPSALDEPHYYPAKNNIVVGGPSAITGLASWGELLVIFKRDSVWTLAGWSNEDWALTQQPELPGCVGYGAYAAGPPGVVWLASDGYYFWNGASLRLLAEISDETPWAVVEVTPKVPMCAYHDGRYYMVQEDGIIEWCPATDQFTYRQVTMADSDGHYAGLVAVSEGTKQTHLLTRMLWATGGNQEITVLDATYKHTGHSGAGSSYSDLYAPVRVTLPPLDAPPGYQIMPLEVWVSGTWEEHTDEGKRVKIVLTPDGDYSTVQGDNVWATTPDAPQEGEVLGIPPSYEYGSGSAKTNVARRWYVQLVGEYAKDFKLEAVTVRYQLRRAPG